MVPPFVEILRDDIVPLLEEYCYEDFEALERIPGSAIVQRAKQRIDTGFRLEKMRSPARSTRRFPGVQPSMIVKGQRKK